MHDGEYVATRLMRVAWSPAPPWRPELAAWRGAYAALHWHVLQPAPGWRRCAHLAVTWPKVPCRRPPNPNRRTRSYRVHSFDPDHGLLCDCEDFACFCCRAMHPKASGGGRACTRQAAREAHRRLVRGMWAPDPSIAVDNVPAALRRVEKARTLLYWRRLAPRHADGGRSCRPHSATHNIYHFLLAGQVGGLGDVGFGLLG